VRLFRRDLVQVLSRSTVVSVDESEALMTRDVLAMILIPSSRDDDLVGCAPGDDAVTLGFPLHLSMAPLPS
jgi:hypothetical protein